MPRKESEATPDGNGPVPQQEHSGSGQPTLLANVYRNIEEVIDRKMNEITRFLEQNLASLEEDAWQPRLAMEADGQADTKTWEGAATAVQAMYGDSCSANRVDPDPMSSTSFGDHCTGPPTLPCSREDALVDNGAAAPKSCVSHPWRCAQHQPPVAYFPQVKLLQQQGPPPTTQLFGYARPKKRILKGLQFHPPGTTAVSGKIKCLLPPSAGGSLRQNPGKIGCSIQAVF